MLYLCPMSDNSTNKLTILIEADSKKAIANLNAVNAALGKLNKGKAKPVGAAGGALGGILATAKKLIPAMGAAFASREIAIFTKEAVLLAGKMEGIESAFKLIADTGQTSMSELKKVTRGAVDEMTLMSLAVQAKNFKVPLENLGSFFEFATIRAAQTGESVEYLTRSIVTGIGRKSPLILDNLGITLVRLKEAMGKVGRESATVADISKAVAKIAKEETELIKILGLESVTTSQKLAKISAGFQNYKVAAGEAITESKSFLGILEAIGNQQDERNLNRQLDEFGEKFDISKSKMRMEMLAGINDETDKLGSKMNLVEKYTKRANEELLRIEGSVQGLFGAVEDAPEGYVQWATNAGLELQRMADNGEFLTYSLKQMQTAVNAIKEKEEARLNEGEKAEKRNADARNKFLDKYRQKLETIAKAQERGFITPLDAAKKKADLLKGVLVEMELDFNKIGLAGTREFTLWNSVMEDSEKQLLANLAALRKLNEEMSGLEMREKGDFLSIQASNLEGMGLGELEALSKSISNFLSDNSLELSDSMTSMMLIDLQNIDEAINSLSFSKLTPDLSPFQELKHSLLAVDRISRSTGKTENETNIARLAAIDSYIAKLVQAEKEIPALIQAMRDATADTILDPATVEHLSSMFSGLATALGSMAGAFNPDSTIAKTLKLAQSLAVAASAAAALHLILNPVEGPVVVGAAIAAGAAVLASLVGVAGSIGGFSSGGGSTGYNASLGENKLYTKVSGRDLQIVLDREGGFSNRRG